VEITTTITRAGNSSGSDSISRAELEAWQRVLMLPGFEEGRVMPEDACEFMLRLIETQLGFQSWASSNPWQNNTDIDDGA
jgi:hypothetical protein